MFMSQNKNILKYYSGGFPSITGFAGASYAIHCWRLHELIQAIGMGWYHGI